MAISRRTGRSRITILVLVVISVTALTLDARGSGVVEGARDVTLDALGPVRDAAEWVATPFTNAWNGVTNYGDLETENEALRQRVEELEGEVARSADAEAERRELLELQDLAYVEDIPGVAARVTSAPPTNYDQVVTIDRGRDDGIRPGMPVVNGAGLVGRVVRSADTQSVVRLLPDPTSAVGVVLSRSRDTGLARGQGRGQPLSVDLIGPDTDARPGEVVKTSGLEGSAYPPGIPVGSVVDADAEETDLQLGVDMDPIVDFEGLTFVKVLLWSPPDPVPVPAEDTAPPGVGEDLEEGGLDEDGPSGAVTTATTTSGAP